MQKRNFRHLPVISEGGKIVGILSAQDIVDSLSLVLGHENSSARIMDSLDIPVHRIMALHPIVVEKGDGLSEVVKKLIAHNIGALPVIDEMGVVQGIITLRDVVGLLGTGSEPLNVAVSEIMTKQMTKIDQDATMVDAVKLMSNLRIRRLPVLSPDGVLIGMVTNRDVMRLVSKLRTDPSPFSERVTNQMTRDVITIDAEEDVRLLASRMMIFSIGGLVVDGKDPQMVGIVTERDLVKRLSEVRSVGFLVNAMKFELELRN